MQAEEHLAAQMQASKPEGSNVATQEANQDDDHKQALEDFKSALASALKSGEFSSSTTKSGDPEGIWLWGVELLDGSDRADVLLLKFLRAREFRVEHSLKMLKNTLSWRKSFGCDDGFMEEVFDQPGLSETGFYSGVDKGGLPVCYNIIDGSSSLEEHTQLRWRVQLIEKGIKMLDFDPQGGISSMIQVVDLKQFSMKKEVRSAWFNTIQILSDNYPELVSKLIFINVPWYYNALYMMVSPFLTQRTKDKFTIATSGKTSEVLFKYISPDNVPAQYGGLGLKNEELFKSVKATVSESRVRAGCMLIIEIQLHQGDEVTWELSVPGWDVIYGVEFKPSAEGGYTLIVEKTRKIETQQEDTICNSFKNSSAGSLLITIDNSLSKKRKPVVYRYFVKG